jgi:hypothetical protein
MKRSRILAVLALLAPTAVAAQVGADPAHSPYHDIRHGDGWTFAMGHLYGNGGPLRLSPNNGQTFAARYDIRLSGLLQGFAELGYLKAERSLMNPDDSVSHRFTGPIDAPTWTPQIGLQINLSGPKTWHGVAPFIAFGLGAAIGPKKTTLDTTEFQFGTKLLFHPSMGVRYYIGQRIHVRLEASMYYWKMKYPPSWLNSPNNEPAADPPIFSSDALSDWVHTPELRAGLGIAF